MTLVAFGLVNLLLVAAWYYCLALRPASMPAESAVYAGLMTGAQLVLSQLVLGALMLLHRPLLVAVNVGVALMLLLLSLAYRRPAKRPAPVSASREPLGIENVALLVLLAFLTAWMVVAAWLLPPRGIDDVYHLPPLYQYVQDGGISLLPLALRDQFASPFNGEFLFLWPLLFFHADTWIDLVQYVVALYGAGVLYALARAFDVPRREALFVALLLPFIPVVLGQAGSNYVDLILAICQLVLLYAVLRFWQTGQMVPLLMAGCATGFGIGIKYNMLITVLAVQPLLWLRLAASRSWRAALARYAVYMVAAVPLGAFWLVRNGLATGNLLYPFDLGFTGLRRAAGSNLTARLGPPKTGSALQDFLGNPASFVEYVFRDPGLGSLHGGFGVVFWGLAVPALLWCFWQAWRSARAGEYFPALFWACVPLTFLTFFYQVRAPRLEYNQRYIILVVPLGLLALGIATASLRARLPRATGGIRLLGVLASLAAVIQLASYRWPGYQILPAAADWTSGQWTSEYKYFRQAPWSLPALSTAWEPLDFLTRGGAGWDIYISAEWSVFWTAPAFGSQIQNRVWNFLREPAGKPDAFIFYQRPGGELFYVGRRITPEEVARDDAYELVTAAGGAEFWARRALLATPAVRTRLAEFYRRSFGPEIQALEPLVAGLTADQAIVTGHPLGYALRYLNLTGRSLAPVRLVPPGRELDAARRTPARDVVSIGAPLPGYDSRQIRAAPYPAGSIPLFSNRAVP